MDVHIVGAGPAGSIAAISALRNGKRVMVSEEHKVPGIPENCSGLFSKDGLESLVPFINYKKHIINSIHGADVYFNDTKLTIWKKEPVAHICNRAEFDKILASNAEGEGANIQYGEKIGSINELKAKHIIGCDGPLSFVARSFNFPPIKRFAQTLQADLQFNCEDTKKVQVYLSNSKYPGFFAWIIPHDEENAEFGVGVEMPNHARDAWETLLRSKDIEARVKPTGAIIPLETRAKSIKITKTHKVLLAGDAAGQVKSTTGGGVIFGGNCAALAGKYVDDPRRYELEWTLKYKADLVTHKLVRRHLNSLSDSNLSKLGLRLKKLDFEGFLSEHGHMDKPTRMIGPSFATHILRNLGGLI